MKNMLLLSSSKYKNTGYLEHTIPWLQNFLTDYRGKTIAFVPYAGVRRTFDEYEKTVQNALSDLRMNIVSVHNGCTSYIGPSTPTKIRRTVIYFFTNDINQIMFIKLF